MSDGVEVGFDEDEDATAHRVYIGVGFVVADVLYNTRWCDFSANGNPLFSSVCLTKLTHYCLKRFITRETS